MSATREPIGWECLGCGNVRHGDDLVLASAYCRCGRGKGRWRVAYADSPPVDHEKFLRERQDLARQIADLEREMSHLPTTHHAWHHLAHARKEWGHAVPETLGVVVRDLHLVRESLAPADPVAGTRESRE